VTASALPTTRLVAGFHFLPVNPPYIRRLSQLLIGLVCFGVAIAWTLEALLGASPWTVFHEGAANQIGLSVGTVVSLTGLLLLAALWVLKEPLGLGTVLNVAIIGPVVDLTRAVMPDVETLWVQMLILGLSPVLLGLGSGLYLNAVLGPGPRDGIMTALNRRGIATWKARTAIELTALTVGILLGGKAGWGTIWTALAVGPCVQFFLPWFRIDAE